MRSSYMKGDRDEDGDGDEVSESVLKEQEKQVSLTSFNTIFYKSKDIEEL